MPAESSFLRYTSKTLGTRYLQVHVRAYLLDASHKHRYLPDRNLPRIEVPGGALSAIYVPIKCSIVRVRVYLLDAGRKYSGKKSTPYRGYRGRSVCDMRPGQCQCSPVHVRAYLIDASRKYSGKESTPYKSSRGLSVCDMRPGQRLSSTREKTLL